MLPLGMVVWIYIQMCVATLYNGLASLRFKLRKGYHVPNRPSITPYQVPALPLENRQNSSLYETVSAGGSSQPSIYQRAPNA